MNEAEQVAVARDRSGLQQLTLCHSATATVTAVSTREHQWTLWVPREFTSSSSSIITRAQCRPSSVPSLYLDPQIRDWVLFPITLVMVRPSSLSPYLHLCVSLLIDTRRGVKTLCRRPPTVISSKTATSSNPGTVRD